LQGPGPALHHHVALISFFENILDTKDIQGNRIVIHVLKPVSKKTNQKKVCKISNLPCQSSGTQKNLNLLLASSRVTSSNPFFWISS
jgi:hypothetical protein